MKEETHKVIFNGLSAHEGNSQALANEFYAQKKSILIVPSFLLHCNLSVNRILSHLIGHRKLVAFTNNIHSDRFHHSWIWFKQSKTFLVNEETGYSKCVPQFVGKESELKTKTKWGYEDSKHWEGTEMG